MKIIFEKLKLIYAKFERPISSLSLVGGFIFDAVTLQRVDEFWENTFVGLHIIAVAVFLILANSKKVTEGDEKNPHKAGFWYVNLLQFFFGGLLSVYLVFYFRSADLSTSWFFIIILLLAFWANESLKRRYVRMSFQISLFFLSVFSFCIFIVPVIVHAMNVKIFLFSGIISLVITLIFLFIIFLFNKQRFIQGWKISTISIISIFVLMNVMYFTNIIPPIPLSLKDAGVFYSISKEGSVYIANREKKDWKQYFKLYDDMHIGPGSEVYVYSAIFSPTDLNTYIVHKWQYYDESSKNWIDSGKIYLSLTGGRSGGYRTYSERSSLKDGKWRVVIETLNGQVIGKVRFNIIFSSPISSTENIELW